jgi:hypothetical protein
VKNTNLVTKGSFKLGGGHQLIGEILLGKSESNKIFSENQITSGASTARITLGNGTSVVSPFADLIYPSQLIPLYERQLSRAARIRAQLGAPGEPGSPFGPRPRYMHRARFQRLGYGLRRSGSRQRFAGGSGQHGKRGHIG